MSQQLISRNSDLKRLRDEGYQIELYGGYLITHHIPYVNKSKEVKLGKLVCSLSMSGNKCIAPNNHVIEFSGEFPCDNNGVEISGIRHQSMNQDIGNSIVMNHSFSNKPPQGYPNYYEKVKRYAEIISAPAKAINPDISEKPFIPIESVTNESVFKYFDTNSSRANISMVNSKIEGQKIAIIGLGGTGSYILDLVSKSMVSEIHLFDGDKLYNHNAFRYPSAVGIEDLQNAPMKVSYLSDKYSVMRHGIVTHPYYVSQANLDELLSMDFVFLSLDNNEVRNQIVHFLIEHNVKFIDVGLGVNLVDDQMIGTLRVTSYDGENSDHLDSRIPKGDDLDNDYSTNIQIAELNCLNATFAVMKWKKISGFYQDLCNESNITYSFNNSLLLNEDVYEA